MCVCVCVCVCVSVCVCVCVWLWLWLCVCVCVCGARVTARRPSKAEISGRSFPKDRALTCTECWVATRGVPAVLGRHVCWRGAGSFGDAVSRLPRGFRAIASRHV